MEQVKLYLPFSNVVLTSTAFHKDLGIKQICYNAYHKLAYLHPNYFIPDPSVFDLLGVKRNEKFVIIRFILWQASHDRKHMGISLVNKIKIVKKFLKHSKVFISAEGVLPSELESYRIMIPIHKMHDTLAFASLLFGESGTMTSECAMLGTPAIQISGLPPGTMGTLAEQESYGLIKVYTKFSEEILRESINILELGKRKYGVRRDKMLTEKIDVTSFMVWLIEDYPDSIAIMKENPDYQSKFR